MSRCSTRSLRRRRSTRAWSMPWPRSSAATRPGRCVLAERRRWPDTLYASVEPEAPVRALQAELAAAFPTLPLYGGAFEFTPHVTISEGPGAHDPAVAGNPAWSELPFTLRVDAVELIVRGRMADGRGSTVPDAGPASVCRRAAIEAPLADSRARSGNPGCPSRLHRTGLPGWRRAVHRGAGMRLDRRPAASRSPAPVRGGAAAIRHRPPAPPRTRLDAAHAQARRRTRRRVRHRRCPPRASSDLQRLAGNAAVGGYLAGREPTVQRFFGFPMGGFAPAHPELREGNTGEAVRELQEKLSLATAAGGALTTDGDFGPATRRRVRAFRAAQRPRHQPGRGRGAVDGARCRGRRPAGARPTGAERGSTRVPTSPSPSRS